MTHTCPFLPKLLRNGLADAFGAAGDDGNFVFKHSASSLLGVLVQGFYQKLTGRKPSLQESMADLGFFIQPS